MINFGQTALSEEERYYPVLNGPLPNWFGPEIMLNYLTGSPRPVPGQVDKLFALGRAMVDIFKEWESLKGQLPLWAMLQRDAWRTRAT